MRNLDRDFTNELVVLQLKMVHSLGIIKQIWNGTCQLVVIHVQDFNLFEFLEGLWDWARKLVLTQA
jgi:hypothetical protein